MITFTNVSKNYEGNEIVREINFTINQGEFVYIIGKSGSGKTSILKLMMGSIVPSFGNVEVDELKVEASDVSIDEKKLVAYRKKVGIVFQDFSLIPHFTVYENVAYRLEIEGIPPAIVKERVKDCLEKVDVVEQAHMFPEELSGGQQQRVAIARGMVTHPSILIADEPTSNLDDKNAQRIMDIFTQLNAEGVTIVMATHNHQLVDHYQHRVIELMNGSLVRDEREGGYFYHNK